jgi:PAS domain S-box-containing protein
LALRIEVAVARAIGEGADAGDAISRGLRALSASDPGWDAVGVWEPHAWDDDATEGLHCAAFSASEEPSVRDLVRTLEASALPCDEGWLGHVWTTGRPKWVEAAELDGAGIASVAAAAGVNGSALFPLRSERGTVAIGQAFGAGYPELNRDFLATLEIIGSQLGQLTERRRAEEMSDLVGRRHEATLEAALDCVVTMDHKGRILEFNPSAVRTFGIGRDAALGRDMADLIVPEELRDAHRAGLRRYLETGEAKLLDRRIEIEAIREDGERFPVELTITRIESPGDPVFTGHLRDITDRQRQERELRESRTRLVTASDAARRRVERDLHDGAQQQLVSVAMTLSAARAALERGSPDIGSLLEDAGSDLQQAIDELRELARGIHPAVLTEGGLRPALRGLTRRSAVPVRSIDVPDVRLPALIEAAAYFIAAEALTNAARHAPAATGVEIMVELKGSTVMVRITDDGPGGANAAGGGLRGLADRVAALGGTFAVVSPPGDGTMISAEMPCES